MTPEQAQVFADFCNETSDVERLLDKRLAIAGIPANERLQIFRDVNARLLELVRAPRVDADPVRLLASFSLPH